MACFLILTASTGYPGFLPKPDAAVVECVHVSVPVIPAIMQLAVAIVRSVQALNFKDMDWI